MATSESAIIYLFTRTSLHVGSGGSVGAIDLPIIRERHTAFPIIPGSALKGVFADEWIEINENTYQSNDAEIKEHIYQRNTEGKDLFGTEEKGGMLQFSEAKLLLFPIRSPKGCFGWITCPLILKRYCRDTGQTILDSIQLSDNKALFKKKAVSALTKEEKKK
ncbi:type III-B CRISPR module RAMP protein Cmr4 [Candidatus Methylacidiphilum fumarolicum]|uniref:type III-B CRISPR module RAMP protein Cmr4 n=1 Tax=Candidatus Methylacidiphilum fumarolicum TaxID=591154 RepID=UPI0010698450|nr:type III-B CRISPR module RAMP protein Cmr4 [Candidatus Methylacidiphilum fumarolicum]TFE74209.1 type III-B CRISPR module RAMP protein Cmr4 [Candidatus Methylacidiphilum fumarolicum]TFE75708.1 type III-B CRISPR module RAMP protein Cmr4 [Candidatus Methylacidiphilum fumarolicum]TFE75868.1 type III-B CRISPR module RAMP protein Cmr4 [Candidatus Methylacidiphilum fumarolicum]